MQSSASDRKQVTFVKSNRRVNYFMGRSSLNNTIYRFTSQEDEKNIIHKLFVLAYKARTI